MHPHRRRVLFVTSSFPRWVDDSTTPFVADLAQALSRLGWGIDVVAPHAPGAAVYEEFGAIRVNRFRYAWPASAETVCYNGGALLNLRNRPFNAVKLPVLVASEFRAVTKRLRSGTFSLVHSHWLLPQGFVAGLAARHAGLPHVVTVHGGDVFALRHAGLRPFKRAALRWSDAVTANSSVSMAAVRSLGVSSVRAHRVPIGASAVASVDPARRDALRRELRRGDGPLVVFVGRMIEEKGVADLLDAIAKVKSRLPDVTAVLLGDGPDRRAFETRAATLGLADCIRFEGWVTATDVVNYLHAADVFVGPSKQSPQGWVEAQGLVFAEALLAGLPVVACATGGVADLVRHRETGLLVAESAPEQIADAIATLHLDPAEARALAAAGRERAQAEYTVEASAHRFSAIYEDLLNG